jgi:hypothetical protein
LDAVLSAQVLNRTLLQRQHLLERVPTAPLEMVEHLVGLQAQVPLTPYLSLHARIAGFDPCALSDLLRSRDAVRLLAMRGTIHLLSAEDCLELRPLVQPHIDRVSRNSAASRPAAALNGQDLAAAVSEALADGPVEVKALGAVLASRFPDVPAAALGNRARELVPLVQVPPRGLWHRSGGIAYATAERWLGRPLSAASSVEEAIRRYLRAFGPARAADFTAWSGITGVGQVIKRMHDELTSYRDEKGRVLVDLADLSLCEPDRPAPVRLLGQYDNLWLSHADRSRVTDSEQRLRWMGANGGVGNTVFVDGRLDGLWRVTEGGRVAVETFRALTASERDDLDAEVAAMEAFL